MSTATLARSFQPDFFTDDVPWKKPALAVAPVRNVVVDFPLPPQTVQEEEPSSTYGGARLSYRGPIESISMPPGWVLGRMQSNGEGKLEIFRPAADPWCQMDIYYRGAATSKPAADAFAHILETKPANVRCEVLLPKEIRELSEVMGLATIGNNQFTNRVPAGSKYAPNFHIRSAHTMKVNGKTVLAVQGDFIEPLDPLQKPVNSFEGIFIDGGIDSNTGGRKIQELFLQGPASRVSSYRKQFSDTMNSIGWIKADEQVTPGKQVFDTLGHIGNSLSETTLKLPATE